MKAKDTRASRMMRTRVVSLVVCLLASPGVSTVVAAPAHALCWERGCNGQDPHTTGCDGDGVTIEEHGNAQIRRSNKCRAVWGRFLEPSGFCGQPAIHIQIGIKQSDGTIDVVNGAKTRGYSCKFWTTMLTAAGRYARVRQGTVHDYPGGYDEYFWDSWSSWNIVG